MAWKSFARHCVRCREVGPRVWLHGVGLVHYRCLTAGEKRERRKEQREPPAQPEVT